jgi:eukaryotic-like serine/threonine-protein kinase
VTAHLSAFKGLSGQQVGRYHLYEPLASGGMATVYLAWLESNVGFARTVAAKVMHAHALANHRAVEMVRHEARIASRIRHPNVVTVLDVEASCHGPVLIMDYVAGLSLSHLLEQANGEIPIEIAARVLLDVLDGLEATHEANDEEGLPLGVVHRDVSPHNILIDERGRALITDFGVSKALERAFTTQSGEVRGKLAYMSPEQLNAAEVDVRTDVWAVGMILWQALVGEKPFAGLEPAAIMARVATGSIGRPSERRACSATVEAICVQALAVDVDARFASAKAMAKNLEDACTVAPHSDVAKWAITVDRQTLHARAALVREMERKAARRLRADVQASSRVVPGVHDALKPTPSDHEFLRSSGARSSDSNTFDGTPLPRTRYAGRIALGAAILGVLGAAATAAVTFARAGSTVNQAPTLPTSRGSLPLSSQGIASASSSPTQPMLAALTSSAASNNATAAPSAAAIATGRAPAGSRLGAPSRPPSSAVTRSGTTRSSQALPATLADPLGRNTRD